MAAGLSLRTGFTMGGGYSPMTPPSTGIATTRDSGTRTIAQQAYGIQGSGSPNVSPLPAYGSVGVGLLSMAILVYMWYSLPR